MQQVLVQPTSAEHVYYAMCLRRSRWSGYFQLVIGPLLFIDGILRNSRFDQIMGVIIIALAPYIITQGRRVRLIVTADGITYFNTSSVLYAPWQDMEYIGRYKKRGRYRSGEGIILRNAEWKLPHWFPWLTRRRPQFIPLWSRWSGPWWDQKLFDDLFYYAPWLATNGEIGMVTR